MQESESSAGDPPSGTTDVISAVADAVSRNVRAQRLARSWTVEQLAARAGVSKGMITQVELGKTNPSIVTLARLANALGINIGALLELETPLSAQVVPSSEGITIWTGAPGTAGKLLVSSQGADNAELWDNIITGGDSLYSDPHPAGTRELLLVVDGTLTLEVSGVAYELSSGDAATFRGDQAHAYLNTTDAPARYSLTVVWPNPEPSRARHRRIH
jgi:transcriptional regulator with XRE-family HTH domain